MTGDTIQTLGAVLFALAVLHTFSIKVFQHLALKSPEGPVQVNLFHLLGEGSAYRNGNWVAVPLCRRSFF